MISQLVKRYAWLFAFVPGANLLAQSTNWSVNPSQFEFSMTITAVLSREGTFSTNGDDKVAAFAGTVCRGITSPSPYTTAEGHHIVFLQVYSNAIIGEEITFMLYDGAEGAWMNAVNSLTFQNDANIGTTAEPYIITSNLDPTDITLSASRIMEGQEAGTLIGILSAIDADAGPPADYTYTLDAGMPDAAAFSIRHDSLVSAFVLDRETKIFYDIQITASDGKGGSYQKAFTILVTPDPDRFRANNYLSPNGDNKNDVWQIRNIELYKDYRITIYNDAGVIVYDVTTYNNDWGGMHDGKRLPKGVYYFIAERPDDKRRFRGSISINY